MCNFFLSFFVNFMENFIEIKSNFFPAFSKGFNLFEILLWKLRALTEDNAPVFKLTALLYIDVAWFVVLL